MSKVLLISVIAVYLSMAVGNSMGSYKSVAAVQHYEFTTGSWTIAEPATILEIPALLSVESAEETLTDTELEAAQERYEHKQEQKEQMAEEKHQQVRKAENEIGDAEVVLKELRKLEKPAQNFE